MTLAADVAAEPNVVPVAPAKAKPKKRLVVFGVLGVLLASGGAYWMSRRGLESTDDAQVDADVVALAPRTSGVVVKVEFDDNAQVKAGQLLATLDPEPAKARLAQAEAQLEAAKATWDAAESDARLAETNANANSRVATASLSAASAGAVSSRDQIAEARARVTSATAQQSQAQSDLDRTKRLVATGALSQAQLDSAQTAYDTATAQLAQAQAMLSTMQSNSAAAQSHIAEASAKVEQARPIDVIVAQAQAKARAAKARVQELEASRDLAKLDLSYTEIRAPQDGLVSRKTVAVGQTLAAGTPIAQLVPAKAMWITANFKETQLEKMKVGQPVEIDVDALPSHSLHGTVESLSGATGARFALLPPDNASGNYTKVVQRVPVRIKLTDIPPGLRPGLSVDATVDTRK